MRIFGPPTGGCALTTFPRMVFRDESIRKAHAIYAFDRTREGFDRGELYLVCVTVGHRDMPHQVCAHTFSRFLTGSTKCSTSTGAEPLCGIFRVYEASFASTVALGMYTSHNTFMHIFGTHAGGCALLTLPRTAFRDEPICKGLRDLL